MEKWNQNRPNITFFQKKATPVTLPKIRFNAISNGGMSLPGIELYSTVENSYFAADFDIYAECRENL